MEPNKKMIIYGLFPTLAGTFPQWEKHLNRAVQMGFNWVFVNPIQKPGSSGSLYSISDYFSIHPRLLSHSDNYDAIDQVKDVIKKAKKLGLKMMIDLVINHCSVDSDLLQIHPEWFKWEKGDKVFNPFCNENGEKVVWKDLAQFDHRNTKDKEGLYQFFLDIIKFLADMGFKGFRCDAAYQLPRSLWKRLIKETKALYPDIVFLAETLGCQPDQTRKTAETGFDYIFNSSKYWDFHSHWLLEQYALTREMAPSISFPESHDTPRLWHELDGNINGIKQRYLFSALFSAGVMMPVGFELGFTKSLHVVKTGPEDWEETGIDLTDYIKNVNRIKSQYTIFQEDAVTEILQQANPNILLMWKASVNSQEEALIIMNKDIHQHQNFSSDNLHDYVQGGQALHDVSPEYPMDFLAEPFSYDLRPGQGIVLITSRDSITED